MTSRRGISPEVPTHARRLGLEHGIGTFMDAVPAIIILQPIDGPMGATVGIDPYHMGIVVVLTLGIGLITPPYGLCLLIGSDRAGISIGAAMRAMWPFYTIPLVVQHTKLAGAEAVEARRAQWKAAFGAIAQAV